MSKPSDKRRRSRRGDVDPMFPLALPDGGLVKQDRRLRPDRRLDDISVEFHDEVENVNVKPAPEPKEKK